MQELMESKPMKSKQLIDPAREDKKRDKHKDLLHVII